MPADINGFVGRGEALSRLDQLDDNHESVEVVVITGAAGVGKSALAIHWAHRVVGRLPAQLYVDMKGFSPEHPVHPHDALEDLLLSLNTPRGEVCATTPARLSQYRSALAGRRVLLLVDNARDVDQVRPQVSWPTVQRAFSRLCVVVLGEPPATSTLGIDETRFGRPRWRGGKDGRWLLVEPWETGFVDLTGAHGLLGQVDGRTSAAVRGWLSERSPAWRDAVQVVAIDPCAPYAAAVRQMLPRARIAVDHFHLVMAANRAVTAVRQRITRQYLGRRGRRTDPVWVNRRHLLRARQRLSGKRFTTMWNACVELDPSGDLLATWIAKEELRALLRCAKTGDRHTIWARLFDFYTWCAEVDVPEVHTLTGLIETWWPAVLTFLQTGATNAATEGTNRLIKQVRRQACGFRNRNHYRDRVRFHCTRSRERTRARTSRLPAQR